MCLAVLGLGFRVLGFKGFKGLRLGYEGLACKGWHVHQKSEGVAAPVSDAIRAIPTCDPKPFDIVGYDPLEKRG